MSVPSAEAPVDDVVVNLPRRRGPKSYPLHNGVGRNPAPGALDAPAVRAKARLRQPPPHAADVAQSLLFEAMLLTEIDELEDRAAAVERRRQRRTERPTNGFDAPSEELKQLRHRIAEVQRLLDGLRLRFPLD